MLMPCSVSTAQVGSTPETGTTRVHVVGDHCSRPPTSTAAKNALVASKEHRPCVIRRSLTAVDVPHRGRHRGPTSRRSGNPVALRLRSSSAVSPVRCRAPHRHGAGRQPSSLRAIRAGHDRVGVGRSRSGHGVPPTRDLSLYEVRAAGVGVPRAGCGYLRGTGCSCHQCDTG